MHAIDARGQLADYGPRIVRASNGNDPGLIFHGHNAAPEARRETSAGEIATYVRRVWEAGLPLKTVGLAIGMAQHASGRKVTMTYAELLTMSRTGDRNALSRMINELVNSELILANGNNRNRTYTVRWTRNQLDVVE